MIRLIPTLLIKGNGLVKTTKFKDPVYLGDPINAVRIFNEKEVDELIISDIYASKDGNEPNYKLIQNLVSECFMPAAYGGGVNKLDQVAKLIELGVEKIIINTAAKDFKFIESMASIYGSQSVVVSIDVKKSFWGGNHVYFKSGSQKSKYSPAEFAIHAVDSGAGEIIIQSIDNEGSMDGFDIALTREISSIVQVPVVASGGAGNMEDIYDVIKDGGASSIAAGSFFVFKGKSRGILISYPSPQEIEKLSCYE
jgi:cyclase